MLQLYTGPTKEDEHGVKGLKVSVVVSITMEKRFWDTGVL